MLQTAGALVTVYWHDGGHELTTMDAIVGRQWLMTGFAVATGVWQSTEDLRHGAKAPQVRPRACCRHPRFSGRT